MRLFEALDIDLARNELVCFVGAGGKTTSLFRLAKELKEYGKRVLVTTTTAIYHPDDNDCDEVIVKRVVRGAVPKRGEGPAISVLGRAKTADNKLLGIDRAYVAELHEKRVFDYLLVEADGSKQRSIKAPASHEPVLPDTVTKTVGVVGLDVLGKLITADAVHRPELFCSCTAKKMGAIIDEEVIAGLIRAPRGLFKSVPAGSQRYVLLNKADNRERAQSARCIMQFTKGVFPPVQGFIISSTCEGIIIRIDG